MSSAKILNPKSPASCQTETEDDEDDLEKLQEEIAKMEEEAARIAQETEELVKENYTKTQHCQTTETVVKENKDSKGSVNSDVLNGKSPKRDGLSIYVGQVDYSSTPEELLTHFDPCGTVERVTIVCDTFTGRPKGFAYLEFQTELAVENAIKLDGSSFKGRTLKVTHKRVNDPHYYYNQAISRGCGRMPFRGGRSFRGGGRGRTYRGGYRGGYGRGYHPYY